MLFRVVIQTFFLFCVAVSANENSPEVSIKQGILRGKHVKSRQGRSFSSFTAIPYAKPPVGELRFKPSVAAEPWEGVLDATKAHPICPQTNFFMKGTTVVGDEDCLYVNVYTPKVSDFENNLLPVMFYIHGGGWVTGSANFYGPELLLDKDVVLVTVNYRLGPLGFFTTGDMNALGNDGLKDQALAIKWTKDNIAKFGGDPESITLFGQSAGGASAHFHMLSPLSKDLIKGVIAQSGTALSHWSLMPHWLNARRSKILAGNLGCLTRDNEKMMECIRKLNAYDIIKETSVFLEWDVDPLVPFKPVIEAPIPGAFLPEDPIDIIKSGKAAKIPFITGLTTDDGAMRAAMIFDKPDLVKDLDERFETIAPDFLMFAEGVAHRVKKTITEDIKQYYFGDKAIDDSTKPQFIKMYTDATILAGADVSVEMHAKFSTHPVYYYLFGYKGSAGFCKLFGGSSSDDYGVCHGDELLYLLNCNSMFSNHEPSETDKATTEMMTTLWTNFAKYGNPTPEADTTISVKWEPVQRGKQNYYFIKSESDVQLREGLYTERAQFWRHLPMNVRTDRIRDEL